MHNAYVVLKMPYVTFDGTGQERTGNKLIKYLTCKVISRVFGHIYSPLMCEDAVLVKEEEFEHILKDRPYYLGYVNIQIVGLFQQSSFFVPYRKALLDMVYDPLNEDYWTLVTGVRVYVKNLVKDVPFAFSAPSAGEEAGHDATLDDDIFMSLRLDDFMHDPWHPKSDIPYASYYTDILATLSFKNLYIICDTVRYEWELKYIQQFSQWDPILLQESFEHDCSLMRNCKRLIHSNSSLCWVMSFLSRSEKERHIPNTRFYKEQCLEAIESSDCVYYPQTMEHDELKSL